MKEKIELMLKVYRERLEKAQRPPIDHVLGIQTEAQIAILESLLIYAMQEETRANKVLHADVAICEDCKKNPALEGCSVCAECGL